MTRHQLSSVKSFSCFIRSHLMNIWSTFYSLTNTFSYNKHSCQLETHLVKRFLVSATHRNISLTRWFAPLCTCDSISSAGSSLESKCCNLSLAGLPEAQLSDLCWIQLFVAARSKKCRLVRTVNIFVWLDTDIIFSRLTRGPFSSKWLTMTINLHFLNHNRPSLSLKTLFYQEQTFLCKFDHLRLIPPLYVFAVIAAILKIHTGCVGRLPHVCFLIMKCRMCFSQYISTSLDCVYSVWCKGLGVMSQCKYESIVQRTYVNLNWLSERWVHIMYSYIQGPCNIYL